MNPRVVTIHVSVDGLKFKFWDKLRSTSLYDGADQLFSCVPIISDIYPYVVLEINENFGDERTCINRLLIYTDEIVTSPESFTTGRKYEDREGKHTNHCDDDNMAEIISRSTVTTTDDYMKDGNSTFLHQNYMTKSRELGRVNESFSIITKNPNSHLSLKLFDMNRRLRIFMDQFEVKRLLCSEFCRGTCNLCDFNSIDILINRKHYCNDANKSYAETLTSLQNNFAKKSAHSMTIYTEEPMLDGLDRKGCFRSTARLKIGLDDAATKEYLHLAVHKLVKLTLNNSEVADAVGCEKYRFRTRAQLQNTLNPYPNLQMVSNDYWR